MTTDKPFNTAVIGGGFFGCFIAASLAESGEKVVLLERENDLLLRASYVNQARVHNGYHYPRNLVTAMRSCINYPRFVKEFRDCIDDSFQKLYAIARNQSKVNAFQFRRVCSVIGAPLKPASTKTKTLFNPNLIEEVFQVEECAFDANKLREMMRSRLERTGVDVRYSSEVSSVIAASHGGLQITCGEQTLQANRVFQCTYSNTNPLLRRFGFEEVPIKHEITEVALIEVPEHLRKLGITVMDGPFFSTMPFPALSLHSLTHVSYTPHESWTEPIEQEIVGAKLASAKRSPRHIFMLKDAARFLPSLAEAKYKSSLFDVKAVLQRNEIDDGRPVLLRSHHGIPGFCTIMGAKFDNVYDVMDAIRTTGPDATALQGYRSDPAKEAPLS